MNYTEVPFLGKTYAFDLLKVLEKGEFTFTGLLNEIKVSRATLSNTLQALVDEGYVNKEAIGRYTVYRIAEKGLRTLQPESQISDVLLKHLRDYVVQRLEERGIFQQYEIDEKDLSDDIQKSAQRHLREIVESVERFIKEGR